MVRNGDANAERGRMPDTSRRMAGAGVWPIVNLAGLEIAKCIVFNNVFLPIALRVHIKVKREASVAFLANSSDGILRPGSIMDGNGASAFARHALPDPSALRLVLSH